jgi:hypothetical protein
MVRMPYLHMPCLQALLPLLLFTTSGLPIAADDGDCPAGSMRIESDHFDHEVFEFLPVGQWCAILDDSRSHGRSVA